MRARTSACKCEPVRVRDCKIPSRTLSPFVIHLTPLRAPRERVRTHTACPRAMSPCASEYTWHSTPPASG